MKIEPLPWESELLGKKSGRLDLDARSFAGGLDPGNYAFLSTRVAAGDEGRVAALVRAGFELVETTVAFRRPHAPADGVCVEGVSVGLADDAGIERAAEIAYETFHESRFHRDSNVPDETARRSRSEWVRNSYGGRGEVFLARRDGKVAGFLVHVERDGNSVLDLIGVDPAQKRTGVATALVSAHFALRPARCHLVKTQATNRESLGLYRKAGYQYDDLSYSLHWHRS
jgi:GNAT superfamily N-acetyltransferase